MAVLKHGAETPETRRSSPAEVSIKSYGKERNRVFLRVQFAVHYLNSVWAAEGLRLLPSQQDWHCLEFIINSELPQGLLKIHERMCILGA